MAVFLVQAWCQWDAYAPPFVVSVAASLDEAATLIAKLQQWDKENDTDEVTYTTREVRTAAEMLAESDALEAP